MTAHHSFHRADYTPADAAAVTEFAAGVAAADSIDAFGEQTLLNLAYGANPEIRHVLYRAGNGTAGDRIAGYAQLDHGSAELAVGPEYRRRRLGTTLLGEVKTMDPGASIWAHGNLEGARVLATVHDLAVTRELVYMRADVALGQVLPEEPAGITTRAFTGADGPDWVAVNATAFATHPEQGRLTLADLEERLAQDWFDPQNFWFARDTASGDPLGFMWVKRFPGAHSAEIYVLGVSPAAQGRGLGKYLTALALARMSAAGVTVMDLYVEGDNAPALATYERYGFTRALTHVQFT